jgi:hypothetical protein
MIYPMNGLSPVSSSIQIKLKQRRTLEANFEKEGVIIYVQWGAKKL